MVNWKHLTTVGSMVENEQDVIQECVEILKPRYHSMLGGWKFRSLLFWMVSSQLKVKLDISV